MTLSLIKYTMVLTLVGLLFLGSYLLYDNLNNQAIKSLNYLNETVSTTSKEGILLDSIKNQNDALADSFSVLWDIIIIIMIICAVYFAKKIVLRSLIKSDNYNY